MPNAEALLDHTIECADGERSDRRAVARIARSRHRRRSSRPVRSGHSIRLFGAQPFDAPRERDRILADIATGFLSLGLFDVARDAYLVLVATAQDQYVRWTAGLNLMEIAGRQGVEPLFDRYRRDFKDAELPPYPPGSYTDTSETGIGARAPRTRFRISNRRSMLRRPTSSISCCSRRRRLGRREESQSPVSQHRGHPFPPRLEVAEAIREMRALAAGRRLSEGVRPSDQDGR